MVLGLLVSLLSGCGGEDATTPPDPGLDLTSVPSAGEVVAGVIDDEAVLFEGIAAEGRAGDVLLMNDRARFVIQGLRDGSYYLVEGGGVIDADIQRPEGQPGRDLVEEWSPMFGLGRLMMPERVDVISDGSDGVAVVRVTGYEVPLGLIEGALEAPGFVPDLGLEMTVEYRLVPDTPLLEVTSTVHTTDQPATLAVGTALFGSPEVASRWYPGVGRGGDDGSARTWAAYVGDAGEVAVGVVADPGETFGSGGYELLTEAADMLLGFADPVELAAGASHQQRFFYGVAPDVATLSDAVHELHDTSTVVEGGAVSAPDGPVEGASVVLSVDGAPYTMATTDGEGRFSATVPAGAEVSALAVGRGSGLFADLPDGAGPVAPYAAAPVAARGLLALEEGATAPVVTAAGRGVGTPDAPLALGQPAELIVRADDAAPFEVRVRFVDPDPPVDEAIVPDRPSGYAAAGWARDGEVSLLVEPGTYDVLVHRGPRFELHEQTVTLVAGEPTTVEASLPAAFDHSGWMLGDPHMHAAPSSDGAVTMEHRLVAAAGVGLQLHFGTDHDHVADYRPLLAPLGLDDVLGSVVADEVSPPIRGHFNIYPIEPRPELPNQGAWSWWREIPASTDVIGERLRELHGDGMVLQSNHPTDSGVADAAGWGPGRVDRGDFWMHGLEAIEVNNSGEVDQFFAFWLDLVTRGGPITPVGVSDSHSLFGGDPGINGTWFGFGVDDPREVDDALLADTVRAGRVVVSRGVFLELSVDPGATLVAPATVEVTARGASWVGIDRLLLLQDGVEVDRIDGTAGSFTLDPAADATYQVIAEGDEPLQPVSNDRPWAMAALYVDAGGDGWSPPLSPLDIEGER